ncbi:riboflavin synthase [Lacticaseibacillus baoqingensis]|uniref:Riboflavin synthase n=1 Tax=Lacticaseibacillus baoqingensis TaxID=2486013 RepID=A0ABW4E8B0_9LACO|nr:riboflavin synthase [Lacticaseibacillus baoqingensis]
MFTGIIQGIGRLASKTVAGDTAVLTIQTPLTAAKHSRIGDSVAVDGICLTITAITAAGFSVDVMPETLRRTNLVDLTVGQQVDLELALAANGRLDGHFVLGHVDATGQLASREDEQNAVVLRFSFPADLRPYIVAKGSIAINGVSLTVTTVAAHTFGVSLIPHTLQETVLGELAVGQRVNLETDILGKYLVAQKEAGYAD